MTRVYESAIDDVNPDPPWKEECLIAAAPELYEALVCAVNAASGKPNNWFYKAKAAIAKARGEAA